MTSVAPLRTAPAPTGPPGATPPGRGLAALCGVLAGLTAVGVSELLARVFAGAVSPVLAVGSAVIDGVPPWLKDAAIEQFGTRDKPVLLTSIALVLVGLSAGLGVAARRDPLVAAAGFGAFGLLGGLAAADRPGSSGTATFAALGLGLVACLVVLRRLLDVAPRPAAAKLAVVEGGHRERSRAARDAAREQVRQEAARRTDRRTFLLHAAVIGVGGLAAVWTSRVLAARDAVDAVRAAIGLPVPVRAAPALAPGTSLAVAGISPLMTPNDAFYRIDVALEVPQIDPARWSMRVTGLVDRPLQLTYADLLAMPQVEADITISCVSNEVGGDLVGSARWQGVLLADLLRQAGVRPDGVQVMGRSVDGFTAGFPTSVAMDGRDAMVAVAMNGEPLPVQHGFPARLVVPGLYGYVSAVKWLERIDLTTADADGYWVPRGWSKAGPVKLSSRIDVPVSGASLAAGPVEVAGVAWLPRTGISKVELQVDDGPWQQARLSDAVGPDLWRQWAVTWQATPGTHLLQVRATDAKGRVQDVRRRAVRPDGATGLHGVEVRVR